MLFGVVFELGLLSSYTIVTAQPPDIGKLVDMQITKLTAVWNIITGADKPPQLKTDNVTNLDVVAEVLKAKTGLNGINVDTLGAVLSRGSVGDTVSVTLVGTGYKENQTGGVNSSHGSSGGQIVIRQSETYSITATAMAKRKSRGVEVDVNTIQVTALKKLYQQ